MARNYITEHKVEGICVSTAGMVDPKEGKPIAFSPQNTVYPYSIH